MSARARTSIGLGVLWGGATLAAVAGHAAVAAIALGWVQGETQPSAAPPVMMITLAPLEAPQLPEQHVAPGPPAIDSIPEPELAPPEKVIESEPEIPKLPEKEQAVAVLTPPMPEPRPKAKPVVQDTPDQVKKEEPKKKERKVASRAAAPTSFEAKRSELASAPAAGAARVPAAAMASWKGELMAHLNRHKRYPSGTDSTGTAVVGFRINRSGAVTSTRLIRSSGDRELDQEAVALPRRASPLPKPPTGTPGSIPLAIPINFARR